MKNIKKKTYIESEIDKFLEKCEDKNISIRHDKDKDKIKIKIYLIQKKLLNHLKNYIIN